MAKRAFGVAAPSPSPTAYHVAMDARQSGKMPIPQITALVAKEFEGKLISSRTLVSR